MKCLCFSACMKESLKLMHLAVHLRPVFTRHAYHWPCQVKARAPPQLLLTAPELQGSEGAGPQAMCMDFSYLWQPSLPTFQAPACPHLWAGISVKNAPGPHSLIRASSGRARAMTVDQDPSSRLLSTWTSPSWLVCLMKNRKFQACI